MCDGVSDVQGVRYVCMCGMCARVIKCVMVYLFDVCGVCVWYMCLYDCVWCAYLMCVCTCVPV